MNQTVVIRRLRSLSPTNARAHALLCAGGRDPAQSQKRRLSGGGGILPSVYSTPSNSCRDIRKTREKRGHLLNACAAGQINGTTSVGHNVDRVGVGTGVYSLGAPRQIQLERIVSIG